jgi:hypothetical protein
MRTGQYPDFKWKWGSALNAMTIRSKFNRLISKWLIIKFSKAIADSNLLRPGSGKSDPLESPAASAAARGRYDGKPDRASKRKRVSGRITQLRTAYAPKFQKKTVIRVSNPQSSARNSPKHALSRNSVPGRPVKPTNLEESREPGDRFRLAGKYEGAT